MTDQIEKLSRGWATVITTLLSILIAVSLGISGWALVKVVEFPNQYVCKTDYDRDRALRLEREEKGRDEIVSWLKSLNEKMDRSLSVQHDLDKRTAILEQLRGVEAK